MSIGLQSNCLEAYTTALSIQSKNTPYTDGTDSTILWLCKNTNMKLC